MIFFDFRHDEVPETILCIRTERPFSRLMTHVMEENPNRLWFDIDARDVRLSCFFCPVSYYISIFIAMCTYGRKDITRNWRFRFSTDELSWLQSISDRTYALHWKSGDPNKCEPVPRHFQELWCRFPGVFGRSNFSKRVSVHSFQFCQGGRAGNIRILVFLSKSHVVTHIRFSLTIVDLGKSSNIASVQNLSISAAF